MESTQWLAHTKLSAVVSVLFFISRAPISDLWIGWLCSSRNEFSVASFIPPSSPTLRHLAEDTRDPSPLARAPNANSLKVYSSATIFFALTSTGLLFILTVRCLLEFFLNTKPIKSPSPQCKETLGQRGELCPDTALTGTQEPSQRKHTDKSNILASLIYLRILQKKKKKRNKNQNTTTKN